MNADEIIQINIHRNNGIKTFLHLYFADTLVVERASTYLAEHLRLAR